MEKHILFESLTEEVAKAKNSISIEYHTLSGEWKI